MRMLRKLMLVGSMAIATASTPVLAQQGQTQMPMMGHGMMMGPGMMGQGMMYGCPMGSMMGQGMMGPGMMMGYEPLVEGRLAAVKAELSITDAQTAAWEAYASAVKARATSMQSMHASMMQTMQTGSAVDRMKAHVQAMENMVESMKEIQPVTEALYAALTDEQKKKADVLLGWGCMM
jgi:hypothetical protein